MKNSIRFKLSLFLVGLMALCVFSTWFISNYIMKDYFVMDLKRSLESTFSDLDILFSDANDDDDYIKDNFSKVGAKSDTVIVVIDADNNKVYSNTNEDSKLADSLIALDNLMGNTKPSEKNAGIDFKMSSELKIGNGQYIIQKNHDSRLDSDFFDLVGKLSNGNLVVIRSSIKRVDDSVKLASKLFGTVGIIVTVFGCIAMFFVSNKFAKPIHHMAIIAKRMSDLDFNAKVNRISNDEIGELGKSMNNMSYRLENTISELKTANNELRKDIEKKTQIDEMRKEFLSHVSHELKTPIALIQGYAEGLMENISDDKESRDFYCEVIADEANKMNTMVKKLLALNEIEFGNESVTIERFDVVEMIKNIIASSELLINQNELKVDIQNESSIFVWADEFMIEEVLSNYISNAIHYANIGGNINVFFEKIGNEIKISVFNSGSNIPEEDIDKVWIKFYKVDKARTREYGGSGIGLSIVAATMEAHCKQYGAYNTDDGVVFYIKLDADTSC